MPFGFEDLRPLDLFSFFLPRHGVNKIGGWGDVLDFDAGDFHAPGIGGFVDDGKQADVNGIALRLQVVKRH